MRVLFLSSGRRQDYQCDLLFDGLRELLGPDVVDSQRIWFMYESDVTPEKKRSLYGRGFTLYGSLPDLRVDRCDIEEKLRRRYFDLVVYGSVWRNLDHFSIVRDVYPRSQVALIDGEDGQAIKEELLSCGTYFKRECTRQSSACIPINFAIPKRAIRRSVPQKTRVWATVVPGRLETYTFENERDYFDDYAASVFGVTRKKAGWDCLRHYEILANGCIPFFEGLRSCPAHTMITLPKRFLRKIERGYLGDLFAIPLEVFEACRAYAEEHLTTKALARDFLDAMKNGKRRIVCRPLEF